MNDVDDLPVTGWLGMGALWKGDLEYEGRVRIDGTVVGTIRTHDLLDVGAAGRIEGEVHVAQALVGGVIEGTLHATERVTLLPTAVVKGRVLTPWLDIRLGAQLRAEVEVIRDAQQESSSDAS
ncbi:MAG: polymer-forming cytoskeletal protein [Myxococcales bacterium]|nr:polymer-forming cytoskeletal protein [Myxococcales bacterium]